VVSQGHLRLHHLLKLFQFPASWLGVSPPQARDCH
jgi:hypothetical protein